MKKLTFLLLLLPTLAMPQQVYPSFISTRDSLWTSAGVDRPVYSRARVPSLNGLVYKISGSVTWDIDSISGYPKFVRKLRKSTDNGVKYINIQSDTISLTSSTLPIDSAEWTFSGKFATDIVVEIELIDSTQAIKANVDFMWGYDF